METSRMAQSSTVQEAVSKINALRKLTRDTGFRTGRSQNAILHSLNPGELAAVAEILTRQGDASNV
jgi:hypothetical protein